MMPVTLKLTPLAYHVVAGTEAGFTLAVRLNRAGNPAFRVPAIKVSEGSAEAHSVTFNTHALFPDFPAFSFR